MLSSAYDKKIRSKEMKCSIWWAMRKKQALLQLCIVMNGSIWRWIYLISKLFRSAQCLRSQQFILILSIRDRRFLQRTVIFWLRFFIVKTLLCQQIFTTLSKFELLQTRIAKVKCKLLVWYAVIVAMFHYTKDLNLNNVTLPQDSVYCHSSRSYL